ALLASAAFASIASISATAQPRVSRDTVDPTVPTQLPRTAVPHHYALTVTPHAQQLTFDGELAIDLDVIVPTNRLTLNAVDIRFASASVKSTNGGLKLAGKVAIDTQKQTATFTFPQTLRPGAYRLALVYSGRINTQANGLFALDYKNREGKDARSLFTQFEAADARRFIPSWDEPDYKASFDLTARVPASEMAVSNMPAAASHTIPGGIKEVRFATTPTMSSYLLFFATGDFDRITMPSGGREVGVVMSRGNGPEGRLALESEAQILPYYNAYFGTPFPLPKLDNVAGPGQSLFFGAMENWGAIFTFERILLNDPTITTEREREEIFSVEAHEMAHQWFGDLVTMAWWDDIWLNEGFASWMENRTTEHFHPDWGADVDHVASREAAMNLDSFATTHPIVQQVRTVEQANQAFDTITYQKGESVISMLEGFAGPDTWRSGIQAYIRRHAYQNTRTADLWSSIEGAGAHGLTTIASDFTTQPGVPLITVSAVSCSGGRTTATLIQSEFSNDRRDQAAASPRSWRVPVRATAGGAVTQVVTKGHTTPLSVAGCGPLLINPGQTGYFRTLYAAQDAERIRNVFPSLDAVDQYGTMANAMALSRAGYQPMARALDLDAQVPVRANGKVIERVVADWSGLYDDLEVDAVSKAAIAARLSRSFLPQLQAIGLAPRARESAIDAQLRPTLISELGRVGDPLVVTEANRLFEAWLTDRNAIPGSLKSAWLGVVARNATTAQWDALHAAARSTQGQVERATLYELLGAAKDEALARRALALAITDEPGKTTSAGIISAVARGHPALAFNFVLAHLSQVNPLIDLSGRSRFVAGLISASSDLALVPRLEAYGEASFSPENRKPIAQAVARIRWRAANRDRIRSETAAWLKAHPLG
ncbi:MAG TPA: M1 family metallopeptidase, partial [Sphingomicrobium sp.]|nr:M1 family metallopeptidase [Sphingomicrobium sp.]